MTAAVIASLIKLRRDGLKVIKDEERNGVAITTEPEDR